MSAILKLLDRDTQHYTPLDAAIVYLYGKHPEDAEQAAADYASIVAERDALKVMCAKAYFDIHGGVRKEIYDALGDELGELMAAAALKAAK